MSSLKLFLFDLDGTLVSTEGAGLRALNQTFEKKFKILKAAQSIQVQGKTDRAILKEMIKFHFNRLADDREVGLLSEMYLRELSLEIWSTPKIHVLDGVQSFLDHLITRGDILLGLGTGNLERGARLKLMRTPLKGYFPFGGFGSDAEDRSELLKIAKRKAEERCRQSIDPQAVYVIGDTHLDVQAAHRAGFQAVGVASGREKVSDLEVYRPHHVMKAMTEAFNFLKRVEQNHHSISV